ncbi:Cytochrome b5 reductase 4, partial [Bulinus truncatus]
MRQPANLGCSQAKGDSPNKGCCSLMMNRLMPSNAPTPSDSITGRKKVTLSPGHSLMDWIRLGRSGDLSGVGSNKKTVTPAELAMHNTQNDMWMCIRGKVYNVTPYQDFHPGGIEELMRAAGRDGTVLFDE